MSLELRPQSRRENIVVQEMKKELLVYDLAINKAFCLNETSKMVYELADGKLTISRIAERMSIKLKNLISEDFVKLALNELQCDGLLEKSNEPNNYLGKLSRREAIRQVGLATMIALPVISSLVAPTAAQAASGSAVALLGVCTTTADCQSGLYCNTCGFGSCAPPRKACCKNPSSSYGSGFIMGGCYDSGSGPNYCKDVSGFNCCAGTATFTVNGCDGVPTNGVCICD